MKHVSRMRSSARLELARQQRVGLVQTTGRLRESWKPALAGLKCCLLGSSQPESQLFPELDRPERAEGGKNPQMRGRRYHPLYAGIRVEPYEQTLS